MTNHADAGTRREESIPVNLAQPIALEVHNPNGDVTVHATDRSDVLVTIDPSGPGADEAEVKIDAHDNRITIRASPSPEGGWSSGDVDLEAVVGQIARAFGRGVWSSGKGRAAFGGHAWCDIEIAVPRQASGSFAVHTASGDMRIEGIRADMALNTMSGDARVHGVTGNLVIQTASGDLTIEETSGRLTARSASGDVRVMAAECGEVEIKTASGDIDLDARLAGEGPFRAQSASGDVRLTLRHPASDRELAATLAYQTVSGDAHIPPPFRQRERRRWQAGADDAGGPHIDITTVSGDLSARIAPAGRAPAPPAPDAAMWSPGTAPAAGQPSDNAGPAPLDPSGRPHAGASGNVDRLAVLEAVERGEIDIEEALRRLDAAEFSASASEPR